MHLIKFFFCTTITHFFNCFFSPCFLSAICAAFFSFCFGLVVSLFFGLVWFGFLLLLNGREIALLSDWSTLLWNFWDLVFFFRKEELLRNKIQNIWAILTNFSSRSEVMKKKCNICIDLSLESSHKHRNISLWTIFAPFLRWPERWEQETASIKCYLTSCSNSYYL